MIYIIALLFYAALGGLVVGLWRPEKIIRWKEKPSRGDVGKVFGGGIAGLLILAAIVDEPEHQSPGKESSLAVSVERCSRDGPYLWVEGSVRNEGETTVQFVTVRLTFLDAGGDVVDTGSTYAVGGESLRPGESSTFRWSSQHRAATSCEATLMDYRR